MNAKEFELFKKVVPEYINAVPSNNIQINLKDKTIFVDLLTLCVSVKTGSETKLEYFYLARGFGEGNTNIDINLLRCLKLLGCKLNEEELSSVWKEYFNFKNQNKLKK